MKNCNQKLYTIIDQVGLFLLNRQIELRSLEVEISTKKNITEIYYTPFIESQKITTKFKRENNCWYYFAFKKWNKIPIDSIFRVPISNKVYTENNQKKESRHGLLTKIKFYSRYPDFYKRSLAFIINKLIMKLFVTKEKNTEIKKDISKTGGIAFKLSEQSDNKLKLLCCDYGGVYDKNLNAEGLMYPDQVPVGYYSTEYAVYVFYWLWKKTGKDHWLSACNKSIDFFINNANPYSMIAFNHYEFKILPIAQFICDVDKNCDNSVFPIKELKSVLNDNWYSYNPVNVYALRIANSHLFKKSGIRYNWFKYLKAKFIIKSNQTRQGLIMDNIGGERLNSADITYHQFALACLLIAYNQKNDRTIYKAIMKGFNFSQYIILPDGDVAYYGRGANNIYHYASYVYSASCFENCDMALVNKVINKLSNYVDIASGLPSALNDDIKNRVGWSHCAVPYNGQTLFFLCKAYDNLTRTTARVFLSNNFVKINEHDYLRLETPLFVAMLTRGSDVYQWSEGAHLTGIGGIAALCIENENILLTNEFSTKDSSWLSDIPLAAGSDVYKNRYGKLYKSVLGANYYYNNIEVAYRIVNDTELQAIYTLKNIKKNERYCGTFNIKKNVIHDSKVINNKIHIYLKSGYLLLITISAIQYPPGNISIKKKNIASNPSGRGIQFKWSLSCRNIVEEKICVDVVMKII